MNTYIVFLRGINVAGKNKISMRLLRDLLATLEFKNIQTYIQSGNVILQTTKSKEETCAIIHKAIKKHFSYIVPIIAKTKNELKEIVKKYPFSLENDKIVAFVFLDKKVEETCIDFKDLKGDNYKIVGDVVYLHCVSGFGKTKLTNNFFEKKLQVTATTRNLKTALKLLLLTKNNE